MPPLQPMLKMLHLRKGSNGCISKLMANRFRNQIPVLGTKYVILKVFVVKIEFITKGLVMYHFIKNTS